MKTTILLVVCSTCLQVSHAQIFAEWFRQKKTQTQYSLLQIAKLQLYISYLRKGYSIATKGLTTISQIKNGDLKLHELFFNDLQRVKPVILHHSAVEQTQTMIGTIQKAAIHLRLFLRNAPTLQADDKRFIQQQVQQMLDQMKDDERNLTDVLGDEHLQLNDAERLECIAAIRASVTEKNKWIRWVSQQSKLLVAQRRQRLADLQSLQYLQQPSSK